MPCSNLNFAAAVGIKHGAGSRRRFAQSLDEDVASRDVTMLATGHRPAQSDIQLPVRKGPVRGTDAADETTTTVGRGCERHLANGSSHSCSK